MDKSALAYLSSLYRLSIPAHSPQSTGPNSSHQAEAYIAYIGAIYYDTIVTSDSQTTESATTGDEIHVSAGDHGNGFKTVMQHVSRLFGPIICEVYDHAADLKKEEDRIAVGANKMLSDWPSRNHSAKPEYRARSSTIAPNDTSVQAAYEVSCSVSHRDREW